MKKTLGRVAGAALVGALITLAVSPVAQAADATDTPTAPATTTETAPATDTPTDTPSAPTDTATDTAKPTDTATPPGDTGTAKPKPTNANGPSVMPTHPQPIDPTTGTLPVNDDYVDDWAYGVDLPEEYGNNGLLVIACAAGEPKNVASGDIDFVLDPAQDNIDGRYWGYFVESHAGHTFADSTITVSWDCGGRKFVKKIPVGGGAGGGGAVQGGKSQVRYAPKGGVETGFGGMAQG